MRCPLCTATRIEVIQAFAAAELARLYQGELAELVSDLLADTGAITYASCTEGYPESAAARGAKRRGDRVVVVGCGAGAFAARLDGIDYVGLEFNAAAAE